MANNFKFYENFLMAIDSLPQEKRAEACYSFCRFGIYGELPKDETLKMFCIGVSVSVQKYQGSGGARAGAGRPRKDDIQKNQKIQKNQNNQKIQNEQTKTKTKTKTETKTETETETKTETKKINFDLFNNEFVDLIKKEYKEVFNVKLFLQRQDYKKIIELSEDIEDFKENIPIAIRKLKALKFDGINFNPNITWLLKDNNFAKIMNGEFDRKDETANYSAPYKDLSDYEIEHFYD